MQNPEAGVQKFKEGYNCAQSVLFALSPYTGLSEDQSLKMATGFGAGMGRTQHVCGAVSGGILALNLLYGRGSSEGPEKQEALYALVQTLIRRFEELKSTISCKDLLDGCDLLTPQGKARFNAENMIEKCHDYVAAVIRIVEGIIGEKAV